MKVVAVIPARYGSTRLPGKPLLDIHGKTMIRRVYEQVMKAKEVDEVIVATDNIEIVNEVEKFDGKALLTREDHESGTDRIAEVAKQICGDIYINVQGDEPLIEPELIDRIIKTSKENLDSIISAKTLINSFDLVNDPNIVKVITDDFQNAIYFSRSPIPYNRSNNNNIDYYKHIGIYCYPKNLLGIYVDLKKSRLENIEMLEQLRLIENGYKIKVIETDYDSIGVDTIEDVQRVIKILEEN